MNEEFFESVLCADDGFWEPFDYYLSSKRYSRRLRKQLLETEGDTQDVIYE
jgi:hypothetical protein